MSSDPNDPPPVPEPNPLSHRTSRRLVVAALVLVLLLSLASVYYLLQVAKDAAPSPPVAAPADTVLADTIHPSKPYWQGHFRKDQGQDERAERQEH